MHGGTKMVTPKREFVTPFSETETLIRGYSLISTVNVLHVGQSYNISADGYFRSEF